MTVTYIGDEQAHEAEFFQTLGRTFFLRLPVEQQAALVNSFAEFKVSGEEKPVSFSLDLWEGRVALTGAMAHMGWEAVLEVFGQLWPEVNLKLDLPAADTPPTP